MGGAKPHCVRLLTHMPRLRSRLTCVPTLLDIHSKGGADRARGETPEEEERGHRAGKYKPFFFNTKKATLNGCIGERGETCSSDLIHIASLKGEFQRNNP